MEEREEGTGCRYTISEEFPEGIRIDKYLAEQCGEYTRSQLKQRIREVKINGTTVKLSRKVFPGDEVWVRQSPLPESDLVPENIPLSILFEDKNVVVLNKPSGLVVHPGCGHHTSTLVHGLIFHYHNLRRNFPEEELRPGIVHRLDKDTSGVLITAKNSPAHEELAHQFRKSHVKKYYLAIVKGAPPLQQDRIDLAIKRDPHQRKKFTTTRAGGKRAVTYYHLFRSSGQYSLLVLHPGTGRTHQLRVHLLHLGCPILGDPVYSRRDSNFPDVRLMLHAWRLCLTLPGETQPRTFTAPFPEDFSLLARKLGWTLNETELDAFLSETAHNPPFKGQ